MNTIETIHLILEKTLSLFNSGWGDFGVGKAYDEPISFILVSAVNYIQTKEEAEAFLQAWNEFKEEEVKNNKAGSVAFRPHTFSATNNTIVKWCDQLIHPENYKGQDLRRALVNIERFYEEEFDFLYQNAETAKNTYCKQMDTLAKEESVYAERLRNDDTFFKEEAKKNPRVWLMLD